MERTQRNNANDVNESQATLAAVASGRDGHDRQVVPVHHQATASGQGSRGERAATGGYKATASINRQFKIGTQNVNTLWQPGKFDNLKKEANRSWECQRLDGLERGKKTTKIGDFSFLEEKVITMELVFL